MRTTYRFGRVEVHLPNALLTLALGTAGGLAGRAIGLPLGLLLGSLLAVGGAAVFGLRLAGRLPAMPQQLRAVFIPIIGVSIGGAFHPAILTEAGQWWPSLVGLALFVPVAHVAGYLALKSTGRLDPATAFFGTAPGGLIEAVQMGEEAGADPALLTMLQFLRLILTVVTVPIAFAWLTGHAVGSSAGLSGPPGAPLLPRDVLILLACGAIGVTLGLRLRMPAGMITGPIALSGLAHLTGLTEGVPPGWLIGVTQVVVGVTLGVRFAGVPLGRFVLGLRLATMNILVTMALAIGCAFALGPLVGEPPMAVFLAFAPGGIAEMSLIALSLDISVIYITAHHVLRIVLAVVGARIFAARILR